MTSQHRKLSWLKAINEAATGQHVALPPFAEVGMGTALCRDLSIGRFVSFKRRLVSASEARHDGVEWALWLSHDDRPSFVAVFREPLIPTPERVSIILSILQGWLVDRWPTEQVERVAATHGRARVEEAINTDAGSMKEYWLSDDRAFGIGVEDERWSIHSRGRCLSAGRSRNDGSPDEWLPIRSLDNFCIWLARQWFVIAYGSDVRPIVLRELRVAASRAFEDAQLMRQAKAQGDVPAWWSRHAIRAADEDLPNIFFERQADELVVSWDALSTSSRLFSIPNGEEVLPVNFAVPVLRELVRARLGATRLDEAERSRLLTATSSDAAGGYAALTHYKPSIDKFWLNRYGFSDDDARRFVLAGTSRHPVVGLLRTSQDSSIAAKDYEQVLRLLEPSTAQSYQKLLEVAKGISAAVDVREPWESGYRLAALVREKLGKSESDPFDVEAEVRELGIKVFDVRLVDHTVLGACVGSPTYGPLIVLNPLCPDASGPSGRRITLAHELCHLLFDRSRMLSLARFEGLGASSDRLLEMRANAFAVELLVPMSTLIKEDGAVFTDEELTPVSVERQVSLTALTRHAANLRGRLMKR